MTQALINDFKKVLVIGRYTFMELYKSKILINILLIGVIQIIVTYVASEFTYGVPKKVALDFGLGTLSLVSAGIAIFMGVNLISKDLENRTIYMILSRPVRRSVFILGRVCGMLGILFCNIAVLGLLSVIIYLMLDGELSSLIFWALFFSFLEAQIILLVVILLSLMSNVIISVITTLAIYICGHTVHNLLQFPNVYTNPLFRTIIKIYYWFFPELSILNLKDYVIYMQQLPDGFLLNSTLYALVYSLVLLVLSSVIFEHKNLD